MPNNQNATLTRMALQALESLQAAGVQQLPTPTFTPTPTPTSTPPASSLQRAGTPAPHTPTGTPTGIGNPNSKLCFLGPTPDSNPNSNRLGDPFTGPAGELFNKILAACKLSPTDVYLLNFPADPQVAATELQQIKADFICCLGSAAIQRLISPQEKGNALRGKVFDYQGKKVICTFHPAYLLSNPASKKDAWDDMKMLLREMGTPLD